MNTLRQNFLLLDRYKLKEEREWNRNRRIEFALYKTAALFDKQGKQAWSSLTKPTQLYELGIDKRFKKPIKIDKDRQRIAVERFKKIKGWQ